MAKYMVEVVANFEIECEDIGKVNADYLLPELDVQGVSFVEYIDGSFSYERVEDEEE